MARYHWLPILTLLAGCLWSDDPPPALELDLHDRAVTCDEAKGVCHDTSGQLSTPQYHRVRARLVELPSSAGYPQGGLVITARLRRPAGVEGYLRIQLPVVRGDSSAVGAPEVDYTEWRGPDTLFTASRAAGRIEISWGRSCPCQTGRFELLVTDAGPDKVLDTADDQVRRISRARLRRGDRPFCHRRAVLPIRSDMLVVGTRACPNQGGSGGYAGGWSCGGGWFGGWNDDGWYDEEWVGDWDDPYYEDDWCDCDWTDDGWYEESGWCDDGWLDGGGGSGGSSSGGDGDWGDDDWWDDGDDWGDDGGGWGDDDGGDWGDDDWWDDGDDWGDDGGDDWGDDGGDDWGDDGGWDDGGDDWGDDDDWWDD